MRNDQLRKRYETFCSSIDSRVDAIIKMQSWGLKLESEEFKKLREKAWSTFATLRKTSLQRKPSTGELLSWLCTVHDPRHAEQINSVAHWNSLACLLMVKLKDDLEPVRRSLLAAKA